MIFINPEARINKDVPNIGLAYAATHYNVKVIDLNTMPSPADRFLDYKEDVLGISVQSRTYSESQRILKLYKNKYPDAQVKSVSGFLDIQCCYPYLDFDDKISYSEPFSEKYPFPDYELLDSFELFAENWSSGKWPYAIMTSQGCPYQCIYCMSRNRKWLARSAGNCFAELKSAKEKWGIKMFAILDDCFNVDKERVIRFCELVKPLKLRWSCANGLRADRFDGDVAVALYDSGCRNISFGVESTDPGILRGIKKGETLGQIEAAVDIAKKVFKVGINGFFIIGLPGSSYEKDFASLQWVIRKRILGHFSYYVPFDKDMQYDDIFYGEGARPVADTYSKELQLKIHNLTGYMRYGETNTFNKIYGTVKLAFLYDRKHILAHVADGFRAIAGKLSG